LAFSRVTVLHNLSEEPSSAYALTYHPLPARRGVTTTPPPVRGGLLVPHHSRRRRQARGQGDVCIQLPISTRPAVPIVVIRGISGKMMNPTLFGVA
jgi:hypothetical protein